MNQINEKDSSNINDSEDKAGGEGSDEPCGNVQPSHTSNGDAYEQGYKDGYKDGTSAGTLETWEEPDKPWKWK